MFKRKPKQLPELNTAALPDLIFTILFFFIFVTHLRSVDVKLRYDLPRGERLAKMQDDGRLLHVYVDAGGRVQVENDIVPVGDIEQSVKTFCKKERVSPQLICVSLMADKNARMSVINTVKSELRKVGTIKVNYSARELAAK